MSTTSLIVGPSSSIPSSFAFRTIVDLPASSDITKRVPLPTESGTMCSYASGRLMIALTCRPALCANAEVPTYGACGFNAMFTSSATWCATGVSRSSRSGGSVSTPILTVRFGMIVVRLQFPVRSP